MSRKKVIIDFDENGNAQIDGQNFAGPECDKFLSEIQAALGEQTSKEQKSSYRMRPCQTNRTTQSSTR